MKISTQNEGGVSITVQVDILIAILLCVAGLVIGGGAAGFIAFRMGVNHRRQTAEALIGSAEAEAERIKHEAEAAAEASKKEKLLEAKDEIHRLRNESEKELKERRVDVQRQERRIQQKEETLDRKIWSNYETKGRGHQRKDSREIDERLEDVENREKKPVRNAGAHLRLHRRTGQGLFAEQSGRGIGA